VRIAANNEFLEFGIFVLTDEKFTAALHPNTQQQASFSD